MARNLSKRRFLVVLVCSLLLVGCRDKNDQRAREEAAEAAISLSKVRSDLTKAKRQLNDLREELKAANNIRGVLDKQIIQITEERDNALTVAVTAEQKINELTAQLSELHKNLSALEKELNERNILIESQQITISEQQATIAEQQTVIVEQEETIAALEKIIQEQMAVEEQPQEEEQEEIPEPEPEV